MAAPQYKPLTRAEERELVKRWRCGDQSARHRLITSNYGIVFMAAKRWASKAPLEDLIQEGMLGIMRALETFEPERGLRLSTYASSWIRATIQRYLSEKVKVIRVPVGTGDKVRQALIRSGRDAQRSGKRPSGYDAIAEQVHMHVDRVLDVMAAMRSPECLEDNRFPMPQAPDNPERAVAEAEERVRREQVVHEAMATLTEREQFIVIRRFMVDEPKTLQEIGAKLNLTRERIRQIERIALVKLKAAIEAITARLDLDLAA